MNRLISILLCFLVAVPVFAQEKTTEEQLKSPPIHYRIIEGEALTSDGNKKLDPGIYLNLSAAVEILKEVRDAKKENLSLVDRVNQAREESAGKLDAKTVVIVVAVALGVGVIAGGTAVGFAMRKP